MAQKSAVFLPPQAGGKASACGANNSKELNNVASCTRVLSLSWQNTSELLGSSDPVVIMDRQDGFN